MNILRAPVKSISDCNSCLHGVVTVIERFFVDNGHPITIPSNYRLGAPRQLLPFSILGVHVDPKPMKNLFAHGFRAASGRAEVDKSGSSNRSVLIPLMAIGDSVRRSNAVSRFRFTILGLGSFWNTVFIRYDDRMLSKESCFVIISLQFPTIYLSSLGHWNRILFRNISTMLRSFRKIAFASISFYFYSPINPILQLSMLNRSKQILP